MQVRADLVTGVTPSAIAFDRVATSGMPVVLIHAGIADRRMWNAQWAQLTAVRSAVRLDLRGFGQSTAEPDAAWSHVTDVLETLHHLAIDRCHLVGASFGAGVAVEVALTAPELAPAASTGRMSRTSRRSSGRRRSSTSCSTGRHPWSNATPADVAAEATDLGRRARHSSGVLSG